MGRLRIDRLASATEPLLVDGRPCALTRCHRAATPAARLVGLLATPDLGADEALWLAHCASIHTAFMRRPIGVAFLDADGVVLRVIERLPPWRWANARGAHAVLEWAVGAERIAVGDRLGLGDSRSCPRRSSATRLISSSSS